MVLLQAHIHADHVPHHRHPNSNHLELHLELRAHLMGFALERFAFCSNHLKSKQSSQSQRNS